ncbi:MAG: ATP-binding cassette domain-containing protein [Bacteroidales bacterium]|nr:ATP-binding cassette domain-containing protein [Bacteroidales bacterium]MDE7072228.1 ATP-binding cassette domain-containing protein [Bacteroidales bacterium]
MEYTNAVLWAKHLDVYQKHTRILTDVNLSVNKGDFIYLIGKTGTGKSSLLRTFYADIPVVAGQANVAGYDLATLRKRDIPFLRRKLGVVFQDFQLLNDRNVYENLAFVLRATDWKNKLDIDNRIQEVLDMVGMGTKSHKMPYQLSGGEQQRLSIARALLNRPEVILADEPTGNLDPDTSEEIMRLLVNISKAGCAVLVATHDFLIITKYPSGILVCEEGGVRHETL